jgi:hypothetical protein
MPPCCTNTAPRLPVQLPVVSYQLSNGAKMRSLGLVMLAHRFRAFLFDKNVFDKNVFDKKLHHSKLNQ